MNRVLTLLQQLRQRLESANYIDFRAVDYITEIEAVVKKQSSSQPEVEKLGSNQSNPTKTTKT